MNQSVRIVVLFMLLSMLSLQCRKKFTCSFTSYYQPVSLAFIGYSAVQLDRIIILSYPANNGLVNPLSMDTLYGSAGLREGDTTYSSRNGLQHNGFFKAVGGLDYKIILPEAGKEYTVINIREGETTSFWEQNYECSPGASQARIVPLLSTVSGGNYENGYAEANNYFIFLKP